MDALREIVQAHGACATRSMLDEVIKQEQQTLEAKLKDINHYLSGQVEEGTILSILNNVASIEEQVVTKTTTAKAGQRAAEAAKRAELAAAGLNPRDQLTKENLQRWLTEGKTFSQIAREEIGLRQEEVSAAAKKYGLTQQKVKAETSVKVNKEA